MEANANSFWREVFRFFSIGASPATIALRRGIFLFRFFDEKLSALAWIFADPMGFEPFHRALHQQSHCAKGAETCSGAVFLSLSLSLDAACRL